MATYAVGDLQGCLKPLLCLLDEVSFNPECDQLWCCGDLVNRGPESLQSLRFVHKLGKAARVVLGNHDLHLLAVAFTDKKASKVDTFAEILAADDAQHLLHWLRQQPLIHSDHGYTMVHAGIPAWWSVADATARAAEVEAVLRSDDYSDFLHLMYGNEPSQWRDDLAGFDRLRLITNYLTRMRYVNNDNSLDLTHKQPLEQAPEHCHAWFEGKDRQAGEDKILFGHWLLCKVNAQQKMCLL